jgi:antitoxin (DNA-binding transcriptional repressor) of toxin-antitoxin stability system
VSKWRTSKEEVAMNRSVSRLEVEQNLAAILHEVQGGATFVIVSDGKAVAQISPIERTAAEIEAKRKQAHKELLEHLEQVKAINAGPWTRAELYEEEK